jgi:hypothetical protein
VSDWGTKSLCQDPFLARALPWLLQLQPARPIKRKEQLQGRVSLRQPPPTRLGHRYALQPPGSSFLLRIYGNTSKLASCLQSLPCATILLSPGTLLEIQLIILSLGSKCVLQNSTSQTLLLKYTNSRQKKCLSSPTGLCSLEPLPAPPNSLRSLS